MPKDKTGGFGIREKNHRLKYLGYEGKLGDNQELRILKRGFFVTYDWLFSRTENNFARIVQESPGESPEDFIKTMWKRTDFKLALDEIKLYEVNDANHARIDREIIEREVIEVKDAEPSPREEVKTEAAEAKPSDAETAPMKTGTPAPPETPAAAEIPPAEVTPRPPETAPPEKQPVNIKNQPVFPPEREVVYTPVKEVVINPGGKSEEEYKPV